MATSPSINHKTIEMFYEHQALIRAFVQTRVANDEDATDLVQEVYLRLLEYKDAIVPERTKALAFAIASNVVNDYLRRLYNKNVATAEIAIAAETLSSTTEEEVIGRDMQNLETRTLAAMPAQRRLVYIMRLHEEKTTREIAEELNLSSRTVENHFYLGIRHMRSCFAEAI
ncbi:MAG: sigma-70 family RNA polymerase sigma factor [Muribaculaceae bacterium]|nr:sigma-70 family RNA polymerase sigma factor [Muribaculaceae bacterium]